MSLDATITNDNSYDLRKIVTGGRGRSSGPGGERSVSPGSRGVSRDRAVSRGRSSSRRRNGSRARSQGEESNWKWSILRHDPSERFKGRSSTDARFKAQGTDDSDDEDSYISEHSEEEQISDDETDFSFDINDVVLPNFRISINDFYKKRTQQNLSSLTDNLHIDESLKDKEAAEAKVKKEKKAAESKKRREELDEVLTKKAEELRNHTEILALGKALSDTNSLGMETSKEDVAKIHEQLKALGVEDPEKLSIDYIIEIESKKDKIYDEYKKLLIDKSKEETKEEENLEDEHVSPRQVIESAKHINKEQLRVSKTLTLGNFFNNANQESKKTKDVDSYLIYLDTSPDAVNSLQYTIGSVVKSGDVLYVINSVSDENDIEYYEKQCDKLSELITIYLKLIENTENFTLHVVLETTYHKYPKHLVNELIKYLKPKLFVVGHSLLLEELSNYITDIPLLIVKKKMRRRSTHRIT